MDLLRLLNLTEQITTLRGSAGSGNYAHDGRPGKKGGSTRGGGLRRIGAKKDTPPGDRKKAAKKFRDERKRKPKRASEDIVNNPEKNLSKNEKFTLVSSAKKSGFGADGRTIDPEFKESYNALESFGLGRLKKNSIGRDTFELNRKGEKTINNLMKKDTDAAILVLGTRNKAADFYKSELPKAKSNADRIQLAKNMLKVSNAKNKNVAEKPSDIPMAPKGSLSAQKIKNLGTGAVFRKSDGTIEFGNLLQRNGKFYLSGNERVNPLFAEG